MNADRRQFLKASLAGAAGALTPVLTQARALKPRVPDAVGVLYDATLCIGCKACEVACKEANHLPSAHDSTLEQAHGVRGVWDAGTGLGSCTMTKIKAFTDGTAADRAAPRRVSFIRRGCMHCVDPNCVSACPVSALTKDAETGIVRYNPDACIGCRYCQLACPFNVPRFEFDKPFPKIVKCEMCADRQAEGEIPACSAACPTGANLFGRVSDLLEEAHRRLALKPGSITEYPVHRLGGDTTRLARVADYEPRVYGETDGGGTQMLLLAGVPFEDLGLPNLGDDSRARITETIQHALYQGLAAPGLLLGGLIFTVYRRARVAESEAPDAPDAPSATDAPTTGTSDERGHHHE